MAYTVKELSKLSRVSVRTIHFYEEISLLKPAYYGSNGYRYYEEKELLELQQILFFKELGFSLKQIQKVVGKNDFDQLSALYSHKEALGKELERIEVLLKTIDKTISHLKEKNSMDDKEMFDGFKITLVRYDDQTEYAEAEKIVFSSVKNSTKGPKDVEKRGKAFYNNIIKTAHAIFKELVSCIESGIDPASNKVQKIISKHYIFIEQHNNTTKKVYKALAKLYREHPEFRKQLDPFHSELAGFMSKAMEIFADKKLQ